MGLEPTPELYIAHLVQIFREVRRVLRPDGTVWLNIGDSYASTGGHSQPEQDGRTNRVERQAMKGVYGPSIGLKPGDLVGIPWRLALALQVNCCWLRSDVIWQKPAPMPESVNGWRFTRHRVTIKQYEILQNVRASKRRGSGRHSILQELPEKIGSSASDPLSPNGEGQSSTAQAGQEETARPQKDQETSGVSSQIQSNRKAQNQRNALDCPSPPAVALPGELNVANGNGVCW